MVTLLVSQVSNVISTWNWPCSVQWQELNAVPLLGGRTNSVHKINQVVPCWWTRILHQLMLENPFGKADFKSAWLYRNILIGANWWVGSFFKECSLFFSKSSKMGCMQDQSCEKRYVGTKISLFSNQCVPIVAFKWAVLNWLLQIFTVC